MTINKQINRERQKTKIFQDIRQKGFKIHSQIN